MTLLAADLLANDTDVDGGTLSITAVSNAVNGTVTLNNSGNVVFTPTTGFSNGNGSFKYTVSDGNGGTDLGIVTVAVGTTLNGTSNNDNLSGTSVIQNADGTFSYSANLDFSGADSFTYNIKDNSGAISNTATVNLTINPLNLQGGSGNDTLKFQGAGLTAQNLLLTKNGSNLEVSFENIANSPKVILQNFALENLDNLRKSTGASVDLGNILFNGQTTIQDSFDVFDVNSTQSNLLNQNSVNFLNNLNNNVNGFDNSADVINGQGGNDRIDGKSGNDLLRGAAGNDTLIGGSGNDILIGGADNDSLTGGSGNDQFVYQAFSDKGTTGDAITDFNKNDDKLVLTDLFKSLGYGGSNPISDGYLRFVQSGTSTRVQVDANGGADALSTLTTLNNFTATNLVIGSNVLV
ncbi:MAG: cadherin-like domain-containing protein [Nostoc sp. NMS8]|nr:cadherin-like domain-containing protein [Nostoc sp. NMS8]